MHVNEQGEFRELKQNCSAGEDNHTDQTLINEMLARKLFDDISVLDLGCAGAIVTGKQFCFSSLNSPCSFTCI